MKRYKIRLLLIIAISLLFTISSQSFAQTLPTTTSQAPTSIESFFNTSFWQNVVVAVLSAFLAFSSGYTLAGVSKRQGSGKRLTYSKSIEKGLVTVEKNVKEKVEVFYLGEKIEDLYHIECYVENIGSTVIKSQDIRFEFSPETRILDSSFEPIPEPEMKVEPISDIILKPYERKYKIGHIERNQGVGFRFTTTSSKDMQLELHPFNEGGDVEFIPRVVSKVADEKAKITRFITLLNNVYFNTSSNLSYI